MQGYNCIMIFSLNGEKLLCCKRTKNPYKGLYNLVGGKIETDEDGFAAAYRELREETGIGFDLIQLSHMMDFTYYNQNCYVEVYVGNISEDTLLIEEAHPLEWMSVNEDYFDSSRFAGEGNIGHMMEQVKVYGTGLKQHDRPLPAGINISDSVISIGVDGCKGGWIAAVIKYGQLVINKFNHINEIINEYPDFDEFFVDMVIGLPSNKDHVRPDTFARRIIKERGSTIFPAPCRQAVYADTVGEAYEENERILGKKFTPLTVGIIPKMREMDTFLQKNTDFKNVIKESHPEVCFSRLNGRTMLSKKSEIDGVIERINLLTEYIPDISSSKISALAKRMKCNMDDILDAICLAVTANIATQGYVESIPENPMKDETDLRMQMVIPCIDRNNEG